VRLECERRELALVNPMSAAHGQVDGRVLLQVQITGEDGEIGYGEAAPLPGYDGSDTGAVEAALRGYEPVLAAAEREGMNGPAIIEACRRVADLPQALAAIDLALWDRAGRREGRPLAAMLTDVPAPSVAVNATLTALDRAHVATQAQAAAIAGFRCVKVKVGVGDDAGRVAAARAGGGPGLELRLDANGAWGVEEAVRTIEALAPAGLELVEEPTRGLQAVRAVRERVPVRVSIDETAAEPGALGAGVADAVCLKVSRCGGIAALLAAATLVRAAGAEVYLASTLDGPLGIAAALHAAAALASRGPLPCCGLATLGLFAGVEDPLPPHDGAIALPTGPGLGVEPI